MVLYVWLNWAFWQELDGKILLWIQRNLRGDFITPIWCEFTKLGNHGELWILLFLGALCFAAYRKAAVIAGVSLFTTFLVVDFGIKPYIARSRPYLVVEGLQRLVDAEKSFSFPSGHSSTSLAFGYVMFRLLPLRYGLPILVLAVIMAFSRLYVGVHYPSDVLVGGLIGVLIGELCIQIARRMEKN